MNNMTKELIEFLDDTNSYSNFIESQNGGNNYYYLLEQQEGKILIDYINQLQSNWNSLKEDLKWVINDYNGDIDIETRNIDSEFLRGLSWEAQELLDKMNELEGVDNG